MAKEFDYFTDLRPTTDKLLSEPILKDDLHHDIFDLINNQFRHDFDNLTDGKQLFENEKPINNDSDFGHNSIKNHSLCSVESSRVRSPLSSGLGGDVKCDDTTQGKQMNNNTNNGNNNESNNIPKVKERSFSPKRRGKGRPKIENPVEKDERKKKSGRMASYKYRVKDKNWKTNIKMKCSILEYINEQLKQRLETLIPQHSRHFELCSKLRHQLNKKDRIKFNAIQRRISKSKK